MLNQPFVFSTGHHALMIQEGRLHVTMRGEQHKIRTRDTVIIPAGAESAVSFLDRYVRVLSFASRDGIETLISRAGVALKGKLLPDMAATIDGEQVQAALEKFKSQ